MLKKIYNTYQKYTEIVLQYILDKKMPPTDEGDIGEYVGGGEYYKEKVRFTFSTVRQYAQYNRANRQ